MANTYTQIHLQFIFAPKFRASLINEDWETDLYKYITGIVQTNKHKMLAINGMPDHIHVLAGINPSQSISDLLQDIKGHSSKWINDNNLTKKHFEWQSGYGAFSYTKSHVTQVNNYIRKQKAHHRKRTFLDEYADMLAKFEIEFDERYIFKEPE